MVLKMTTDSEYQPRFSKYENFLSKNNTQSKKPNGEIHLVNYYEKSEYTVIIFISI